MFARRSNEKELIDMGSAYYQLDEYHSCLNKLFSINKLLGFFQSTVKFVRRFPETSSLLDVGCGNGLFILHLSKLFPKMQIQGTDISVTAIMCAEELLHRWRIKNPDLNISFKLQEHPSLSNDSFDIVLTTLVCHHLNDAELIIFLKQLYKIANKAVIINDLHRHPLAYVLYKFLISPLFQNRLITHDGLISIKRGFKYHEWKKLLKDAGIVNYSLNWCFPFRWQLILWK